MVAERLRADYEARVQLRLERAAAQRPLERAQQPAGETAVRPTLEEIRRQARESWLKLREEAAKSPARSTMEHLKDDDLGR